MNKTMKIQNNVVINDTNETIEVTKQYLKKAKMVGTDEYKALMKVRNQFPKYEVIEKKSKVGRNADKGITFDYMESYIKGLGDTNSLAEFYVLKLETKTASDASSRMEVFRKAKKWFYEKYPNVAELHKTKKSINEAKALAEASNIATMVANNNSNEAKA